MFRSLLVAALTLAPLVQSACTSAGVDVQNGGSYFVNSLSNDNFTAVSQFEDCAGTANVMLVDDATEDVFECSDVDASQDGVSVMTTCPIEKSAMTNGTWTLVILANNGEDDSYTGQRTFNIVVAPQQTTTVIPTVTATSITTPTVTSTTTSTEIDTTTLVPVTTTKSQGSGTRTITITPARSTSWYTSTVTRKTTSYSLVPSMTTKKVAATCVVPPVDPTPDPPCSQQLLSLIESATQITLPSLADELADDLADDLADILVKPRAAKGRSRAHRRHAKRDIDDAILTVTDTNTADFVTTTSTSTADPTTVTAYATYSTTSTITPAPVVVTATRTTITVTTTPATRTRTTRVTTTSVVTKTTTYKVIVTVETTPAKLPAQCSAAGGMIV